MNHRFSFFLRAKSYLNKGLKNDFLIEHSRGEPFSKMIFNTRDHWSFYLYLPVADCHDIPISTIHGRLSAECCSFPLFQKISVNWSLVYTEQLHKNITMTLNRRKQSRETYKKTFENLKQFNQERNKKWHHIAQQ